MSRDMFTVIKDVKADKILWASCKLVDINYPYEYGDTCFHSRCDETDAVAAHCDHETGLCDITTADSFNLVYDALGDVAKEKQLEYQEVEERLDDIREARRHATTTEAFWDFTSLYEEHKNDLKDRYWNCALDMQRLMMRTNEMFNKYVACADNPNDLHMYWVNDD